MTICMNQILQKLTSHDKIKVVSMYKKVKVSQKGLFQILLRATESEWLYIFNICILYLLYFMLILLKYKPS